VGRLENKVAFITGAARGQGRAHAVRFAREGATIIAVDACSAIEGVQYPLPTPADLAETAKLVADQGGEIVTGIVDVRDQVGLDQIVADGIGRFGSLDIVVANAGILTAEGGAWELGDDTWQTMLDVNLTGVWRTVKATVPHLINARRGGSIILTSSFTGVRGEPFVAHYSAAKHGVVGLMRSLAQELGPHNIRVNTVNPGNAATPMVINDYVVGLLCPGVENPKISDAAAVARGLTLLDVDFIEAEDIANAVLFLASDEARYISGTTLLVDAGWYAKSF